MRVTRKQGEAASVVGYISLCSSVVGGGLGKV